MNVRFLLLATATALCMATACTHDETISRPPNEIEMLLTDPVLPEDEVIPGKFVLKIKGEADPEQIAMAIGTGQLTPVFTVGGTFEERHRKAGLHLWYEISLPAHQASARTVQNLSALEGVEKAAPVYAVVSPRYEYIETDMASTTRASRNHLPFNDPRLPEQWHYDNDGTFQPGFRAGADINVYDAWSLEKGKPWVIVAVMDDGVDYEHEDLWQNMWTDAQGRNGYNFFTDSYNLSKGFHGTHVAGTIAAINNNGIGVSGIAGGDGFIDSGARVMACQLSEENIYPGTPVVAKAFIFAADNGAVISSNSWGIFREDDLLKDAIDYFIAHAGMDENGNQRGPMRGGLVIAAAGNESGNIPNYPAAYDNVISVAALGPDYEKGYYSNWHPTVNISAPGGDVKKFNYFASVLSTLPENRYGHIQGTSMATPHVSGVAALIVSKYARIGLTPQEVTDILLGSTKDIYRYNPAYFNHLGNGLVDAHAALSANPTR